MFRRPLKIAAFLGLASLVACSSSSLRAGDGFEPAIPAFNPLSSTSSNVTFFVTFPVKGTAGSRSGTFDPSTQSVKIRLGGGAKAVFNTSVASPGCKRTSAGTRCVFKISANAGTDVLSIDSYGKANARGPVLDVVTAVLPVSGTKPSFTIGPIVTNNANHGAGSLPQAVTDAAKGDTIVFAFRKRSSITLASLVTLSKRVLIAGPGASRLTITANGESQLFKVASLATVTISGMTLSRGAATLAPFGGAIYNGGNLNLDDDIFSGNSAIAAGNTAVSMSKAIGRSTFDPRPRNHRSRPLQPPHAPRLPAQSPISSAEGGAVYNAGFLSISDTAFSNNSVGQGSGGAVYSASGATITIAGSTFTGNIGAFGGAIVNAGGASFTSDTFSQNSGWPGGGAPISGAYGYGAAIYSSGALTADNCTFSSNVAGGNISASYGLGGAIAEYGGTLAVNNSLFASNLAGGGTNGSWGRGGAIYSSSGSVSLVGDTFKLNKAGGDALGYGGAVFAVHAVTASTDTFTGNVAYGSASGAFAYGGAVYAQGGFSMNGGSFAQNSASGGSASVFGYSYGGGLDVEAGSNLTTVSFMGNVTTGGAGGSAQGGAIFVNGGSNTWNAVTLSGNGSTSTGQLSYSAGGAVMAFAPLTVTGAQVTGNTAYASSSAGVAGAGGGLAVEVGPFAFSGTISENKATTQGGGIWLGGAATVTQSTIAANGVVGTENPNDGGGGIYDDIGGSLVLQTSTVSSNTVGGNVAASGGGGIFNAGSATISNSTISLNSSAIDGGGVENEAQSGFSLTNVTLYQNAAAHGNGGNIKNLFSDAGMLLANSIVAGGSATTGPDVSNDGAITSEDYNIFQTAPSGTSVTGTTTHNLQTNPLLLPLTNNGGPTQTNADQATSPGTGYIPYSVCSADGITTDQRGDPRGAKGFCDVGAFEF